ncbi:MAG TPA: DinB family protein [Gemmatimonadales bacterium]|nr:DinB family protein [Gemmatimonadales bacterium]
MVIPRPAAGEFDPYFGTYIGQVPGEDALPPLVAQRRSTMQLFEGLTEAQGELRYAAGKWSIKEIVGHLADAERIFAYRLLRIARADPTPLASFDENAYVPAGRFDRRPLPDLAAEFAAVRDATLYLLAGLDAEALSRVGTASGKPISARALAWIIAGHQIHHLRVIRERYLS